MRLPWVSRERFDEAVKERDALRDEIRVQRETFTDRLLVAAGQNPIYGRVDVSPRPPVPVAAVEPEPERVIKLVEQRPARPTLEYVTAEANRLARESYIAGRGGDFVRNLREKLDEGAKTA